MTIALSANTIMAHSEMMADDVKEHIAAEHESFFWPKVTANHDLAITHIKDICFKKEQLKFAAVMKKQDGVQKKTGASERKAGKSKVRAAAN